MAGDWIPMRIDLRRDPKVIWMADALADNRAFISWLTDPVRHTCNVTAYEHVTRNVTVALCVTALVTVWGVAREQGDRDGDDLIVSKCDLGTLDAITEIPGFGPAMGEVGWAIEREDGSLCFPKFFARKQSPHERHALSNAERQARYRKRKQRLQPGKGSNESVTESNESNVTNNAPEKRREEKSIKKVVSNDTTCAETAEPSPALMPILVFPCDGKPAQWPLTQAHVDKWRPLFPSLDLLALCREAFAWIDADPGRRKTFRGMDRFLVGWFTRTQNRGGGRKDSVPQKQFEYIDPAKLRD